MHSCEGEQGVIYFAYGVDKKGIFHGIWGHRGIAEPIEFKKDTSLENVRQVLVNTAASHIEMLIREGLLSDAA